MQKISEKVIADNGYRKCIERIYRTNDDTDANFLVLGNSMDSDGVGVLGLTKTGKFIFIDEFRVGPEKIIRSCVLGGIEKGSNNIETAQKELQEETGYAYGGLIPIVEMIQNPYLLGRMHLFLAIGCEKIHDQELEIGEEIVPIELTGQQVEDDIFSGKIQCPFATTLYFAAKQKTNNFTNFTF